MDSIIDKQTKSALTNTLLQEIEILAQNRALDKSRMDWDKFDPLHYETCFMAQIFKQNLDESGDAEVHRNIVGKVPYNGSSVYRNGTMTPLEVWSAEQWTKGNRPIIRAVFSYIKEGGTAEDFAIIKDSIAFE